MVFREKPSEHRSVLLAERECSYSRTSSRRGPDLLGGSRVFISARVTEVMLSMRKPKARIVQGKPIFGRSVSTIAGNTMPPVAFPPLAIASAKARFFVKYVEMQANAGVNMIPLPMPVQRPWAKNSCQYSVHREVMNIPKIWSNDPVINTARKYPASVARPEKDPMANSRQTWTDPTQDIAEGVVFSALT